MERMLIFMDYANINIPANNCGGMNYGHLLQYLAEGRFLIDGYCYVPIDPRRQMERARAIDDLWEQGWNVQPKLGKVAGETYKCNVDVEIAIDMLRAAHNIRPDIIVLCSGDEDFLPVIHEVRRMGIRVEVAAFEQGAARKLRQQASGFISLDVYHREWLEHHPREIWLRPEDAVQGQDLDAPEADQAVDDGSGATGEIPSASRYLP